MLGSSSCASSEGRHEKRPNELEVLHSWRGRREAELTRKLGVPCLVVPPSSLHAVGAMSLRPAHSNVRTESTVIHGYSTEVVEVKMKKKKTVLGLAAQRERFDWLENLVGSPAYCYVWCTVYEGGTHHQAWYLACMGGGDQQITSLFFFWSGASAPVRRANALAAVAAALGRCQCRPS